MRVGLFVAGGREINARPPFLRVPAGRLPDLTKKASGFPDAPVS
jgi:hypothetical protein